MKFHLLILFCSLLATPLFSQNIDSLLAEQDEAITLVEKFTAEKALIDAYHVTRQFDKTQPHLNNLIQYAKQIKDTDYQAEAYRIAGFIAYYQDLYDKSDSLLVIALKYATKKETKARIYDHKFQIFVRKGGIEKCAVYLQKMRKNIEDTTSLLMSDYYFNLSLYYSEQRDLLNKLIYLQKAKKIVLQHGQDINKINHNLTIVYEALNAYENALSMQFELREYAQKNADNSSELFSFFGIMTSYYGLKQYDKVKKYGYEAINLKNRTGVETAFGYVYYLLGCAHLKEEQLDSAAYYFTKGVEISERRKEVKELGDNHSGLCELYYIKGDFEKAKFHGEEVMKHISYIHQDNNSILGKIYEKTGDYKRAYELLRTNWSDWEQTQKERRDYELIANLINEKFEGEIETLRKYKELQALTIRNQNYLVFIAFVLLLLFGLIGLFFWKQYQRCKALSESQKKIIEQEKKTNLVKTQFFSNVSHELRTPLTLITGNLNLISDNNDMQNDALTAIKKAKWQSQEMLSMLDNILVLTKNEMIAQEPKPRLFLLNDFTVYMNEKVSALAARKEILFETKNSIETSTIFTTDVEMLTTVVKNLLDNAFKYTQPGGKVTIDYQMEDKRLKISVLDSGRGIPDTDLPYIFDRYYQVSDQDKPQEGGFGIGLSICKEYVDAMGGSIAVDSVQGEYTRFTFWIPSIKAKVDQGNLYQFKIIKSPQIQVHASPKQADDIIDNEFILIAEDNLEMCDYLNTLLSKEYHVLFVHNGKEVLRILERHRPMLIITDLMMPVMDGMTMIEQLRNNKRHANIPIIILSAKDSVVDEIKAARFGVEEYLRKPFQEEKLQAHIYHLLHLDEQRSESLEEAPIEEDYIDHLKRSKLKTSKELVASVSDREWVKMVEEKISPLITDMNLNVDKICEVLEISPTHLTRQMKELIGMTPKRYVNELRLLMGRRMLENKEYNSVKAVAYSVGFNSDKVFSRNFKARFGKHPSAYLD